MKRKALITLILGTALAVAPTAGAVVLSDGGGGGAGSAAAVPSAIDPATQAVILRSEEMSSYYTANPVVDPATQAVIDRSKALGDYYGANGVTLHTDVLGGNGGTSATPISTDGDSFNWSPILASTLAGMLLQAIAATAMTRRRHSLSF
jgi:hypothetical protein